MPRPLSRAGACNSIPNVRRICSERFCQDVGWASATLRQRFRSTCAVCPSPMRTEIRPGRNSASSEASPDIGGSNATFASMISEGRDFFPSAKLPLGRQSIDSLFPRRNSKPLIQGAPRVSPSTVTSIETFATSSSAETGVRCLCQSAAASSTGI